MGDCNSRERNRFSYANINNKRSHLASFSAMLITQGFSCSVQPAACVKSRKFGTGTFDRCEGFLASYAVYKYYCIKICFAKGKHYLWKEFSFHEEESSTSGTICRISIIRRHITQISKVTCSPRHITEYVQGFHFPDRNNYKRHARIISYKELKQAPEILIGSSYKC